MVGPKMVAAVGVRSACVQDMFLKVEAKWEKREVGVHWYPWPDTWEDQEAVDCSGDAWMEQVWGQGPKCGLNTPSWRRLLELQGRDAVGVSDTCPRVTAEMLHWMWGACGWGARSRTKRAHSGVDAGRDRV